MIEASGSTSLMQVGNNYALYPVGGSSGPLLRYSGAAVTVGQFGALTAIGAEQVSGGGYQVAWKNTSTSQYTVWNTDSSGNYLSVALNAVAGSNSALQDLENTFQQDLNGDGTTGTPPTVIEAYGSTSLVQVGNTYSFYPVGGSSGPQLRYAGAAITVGQIGTWNPIGVEQTSGGYQVAWKVAGADQYTVWNTDSSGNYLSSPIGAVSGSDATLKAFESTFNQDLNGDGTTGVVSRFDITVNYTGNSAYQSYFTVAAQRWQQIITADLPNVNSGTYGLIDDLLITANVSAIDGVGGILGQAGPDLFRSGSLLPYHGVMTFDSADLASMASNGTLPYVILHEMGHILGIGTLWSSLGLKSGFQYTGANALAAYRQLSGNPSATYVPLETGGGSGTAGAHWSEAIFGNELMTGYIAGVPDPISSMTIGTLKDLGYTVNTAAADAYTMPGHLTSTPGGGSSGTGAGQLAGDNVVGTLGFETDTSLDLLNDEIGNGHSGVVNLALFTDYIASTFVTQPGEGTGNVTTPQTSGQEYLTRPAA